MAFGPALTGGERDHFDRRIDEYDPTGAVRDLTRGQRSEWWAAHRAAIAATGIPFLTVAADAGLADHEAEAGADGGSDLQLRIPDTRLDLPSFVALAVVRTDHWDIAYPHRDQSARGTAHVDPLVPALPEGCGDGGPHPNAGRGGPARPE